MKKSRYSNTFVQSTPINAANDAVGTLLSEYTVREYWDLRTTMVNNKPVTVPIRAYHVSLRQSISVCNANAVSFGTPVQVSGYTSYPLLIVQGVNPTPDSPMVYYIEDYSPKTINAAVNTTQNAGTDSANSTSSQHTSGSSTSETNGFEVSASVGFFGADPTGSVSDSYSSSTTNTTENSNALGQSQSLGKQANQGDSMSIKDWASYAIVDAAKQNATWVWGQEHPWNVIDFRNADANSNISLPSYVQGLMYDSKFLYPPSQLSQFGVNFIAKSSWLFYESGTPGNTDEIVDFDHVITYWVGSHSIVSGSLQASASVLADNIKIETLSINLPVLSLEAITYPGTGNGAVVGFVPSEFIVAPAADANFRLKSNDNNLYITQGKSFDAYTSTTTLLTATNITTAAPASFTVQFKVTDPSLELGLHMKHWKIGSNNCLMTIAINGQSVTRHIDAENAGSGADNITTVLLRTRDYTAPDFYDYLLMGLNTISISIQPADGQASCSYALRALAIQ